MNKKLSIAFVLDGKYVKGEGVSSYVETLGDYYRTLGHDVFFIVSESDSTDPRVHKMGRTISVRFNGNRVDVPVLVPNKCVNNVLSQIKPDILHIQMPYSPLMGGRFINHANLTTAVVGTFHIYPRSIFSKIGSRVLRNLTKSSIRKIKRSVSVSSVAQAFARSAFRIQSVVIPCPVDLGYFQKGKKIAEYNDNKINIVFFGRLVERKGCQYLLDAIKGLDRSTLANVRLIIAGDGSLQADLKTRAAELGMGRYVEFLGFIEEKQKANLLASADIAVFPSVGGESFGIVLVEAMASGAGVVIGGNNEGYRAVLDDADVLFDPKNTPRFTKLLTGLIEDDSLRANLHIKQQQIVKQYDVSVVGPKVLSIYEEALVQH